MRRALVLSLCAGAAGGCFSDRGLALEVDVPEGTATSVELYVGNAACAGNNDAGIDCSGIAPPVSPTAAAAPLVIRHLIGHVWFREDAVPYVALVHGGKATFRLQADEPTTLPIVVVVGIAGAQRTGIATIHDVAVPVNTSKVVTTALATAHPISVGSTAGEERRVQTWPDPETDGHACVAVEHWSGGNVQRDFIVPPDDPDCDGFARGPAECDPAAYRSVLPSADSAPTCFAEIEGACRIGAPGCIDGIGETHRCESIGICAPDGFCDCAQPTADPTCPPTKIATVPHIQCTVGVSLDGQVCQAQTTVSLDGHYPGGDCGKPTLSALRLDDIAKGDAGHTFDGAELEVAHNGGACNLRIRAKSGSHGAVPDALGLIKLAAGDGSLVVPIRFEFTPMAVCTPVLDCQLLEPGLPDAMWSCVKPPTSRQL